MPKPLLTVRKGAVLFSKKPILRLRVRYLMLLLNFWLSYIPFIFSILQQIVYGSEQIRNAKWLS